MTKKTNHIIHIRSNVHHTTHQVLYNIRIVDSFNITFSSSIWSHISKLRAMDLLKNYFNSWIATLRLLNNWGKWRGLHFVEFIQPNERSNVEPTRVILAYSQPYKMRKVVHIVFFLLKNNKSDWCKCHHTISCSDFIYFYLIQIFEINYFILNNIILYKNISKFITFILYK